MNFPNSKFYPARTGIVLVFAFCLFSFSGCSSEKKITEPEVLEVISMIEAATKNKDADSIVANLSEKVQIKVIVTADGQTQHFTFDRSQYGEYLKKAFAVVSDYTYSRQTTHVKISADGKSAIASDEIMESMTLNGKLIRSVSTEVATFVRENGKIVILLLEATGKQN